MKKLIFVISLLSIFLCANANESLELAVSASSKKIIMFEQMCRRDQNSKYRRAEKWLLLNQKINPEEWDQMVQILSMFVWDHDKKRARSLVRRIKDAHFRETIFMYFDSIEQLE